MRAVASAFLPVIGAVVLADNYSPPVVRPEGFTFQEILAWLTSCDERSLVSWDISPVVNAWCSSLPRETRVSLMSSVETYWQGWRLTYVPGKFLSVGRLRKRWTLFDMSGFWPAHWTLSEVAQRWSVAVQSILWSCEPTMRSEWRGARTDDMVAWCAERAATIAALADRLVAALTRADLKPSKLIGAGSIASRILREADAPRWVAGYRPDRQPVCNGTELLPLFYSAYYGGRQEMTVVGTWRSVPTYRYDLASAYPWALSWLAPVGYIWEETSEWTNDLNDRMSLWYVTWNIGPGALGPLPYRDVMGRTTYPLTGRGWYWWPEVQAAISAYGTSAVSVVTGYISPRSRRRPLLAQIARRYSQRKALEADGDPLADVLKTGLAACWGRLAQQLGEDCLPGRFYNVALAGWVTSAIRARLIRAYAGKEGYVCSLMTDGLLSTAPLDARLSDELGGWREDTWSAASLILPGLYRLETDDRQVTAATGLAGEVDFDALLRAVSHGGQARLPVRWFAPNLLADLYPDRWGDSRCRWVTTSNTVNPYRIARKRDGAEAILSLDFQHDFAPTSAYHSIGNRDSEGAVLPPAWRPGGTTAVNEALSAIMRGKG